MRQSHSVLWLNWPGFLSSLAKLIMSSLKFKGTGDSLNCQCLNKRLVLEGNAGTHVTSSDNGVNHS